MPPSASAPRSPSTISTFISLATSITRLRVSSIFDPIVAGEADRDDVRPAATELERFLA